MQDGPATAIHGLAIAAPLHHRAPIAFGQINIHADPLQPISGHLAKRPDIREICGIDHDNALIGIARFTQSGAGAVQITRHHRFTQILVIGGVARPKAAAERPIRAIIPTRCPHVIFLQNRKPDSAANAHIIKGRVKIIHAQHGKAAGGIRHFAPHITRAGQQRLQIRMRPFPPINLAILQSRRRCRGVWQDMPFNAPEMRDLAARCPGRRFLARLIGIKLLIHHAAAGVIFAGDKAIRARSDHLRDTAIGIGLGQAFGHDEGHGGIRLGQRIQQQGEGALQADFDGAVIHRAPFIHLARQQLAEGLTRTPALQACDAIAGAHGFAIMETQTGAQRNAPALAIIQRLSAFGHLRLRLQFRIHAIKRVKHMPAVIAGHGCGGEDRVKHAQIGLRHETERLRTHILCD